MQEVGQKKPNAFKLYDMLGNVWEWVADWYDPNYYERGESRDPVGPSSGEYRVLRGGSYSYVARSIRVSERNWLAPNFAYLENGFRCAGD